MSAKKHKPQGHYCKVCGEHKANEKFSGKGHAAHICKKCAALPVSERNGMTTLNRIENMALRYLSEAEIKWLRGKMHDKNPEIAEAARDVHGIKFPRYERNMMKKGLTAHSLEFFIHGDIYDEYGDEVSVNARFFADNTGVLRRIDYTAPENERETEIDISKYDASKFLKAVVQQLNAPFWDEDLSDRAVGDNLYIDDYDDLPDDFDEEVDDMEEEPEEPSEQKEPLCSLSMELNDGSEKVITFYNQLHDAPQELYWLLMDWFAPEGEDEFDEDDSEDSE